MEHGETRGSERSSPAGITHSSEVSSLLLMVFGKLGETWKDSLIPTERLDF